MKPAWTIKEISPTVHRLEFLATGGWNGSLLLMSDEHWDNAHADLPLIKEHHDEAVRRNAPIVKVGDTLCLMQGKWDKRSDQNQLREEHRGNNYLDRVAETAAAFYAPYAKQIALITPGNHECSISQHHQTDMLERLIEKIQHKSGKRIFKGGYVNFLIISAINPTSGQARDTLILHLGHGYGGGGEVTRGMIDNNRTRGQYFADVYYSGHIHRRNLDENEIISCTPNGNIKKHRQWFLRGSSYKDEFDGGKSSFHIGNGRAGRPKGGWWLNLSMTDHKLDVKPVPA